MTKVMARARTARLGYRLCVRTARYDSYFLDLACTVVQRLSSPLEFQFEGLRDRLQGRFGAIQVR